MPPTLKPGWKTTEALAALVPVLAGALVLFGVIPGADRGSFEANALAAGEKVAGLVAIFWAAREYIHARREAKRLASEEAADLRADVPRY
jgi:hypothetical protein